MTLFLYYYGKEQKKREPRAVDDDRDGPNEIVWPVGRCVVVCGGWSSSCFSSSSVCVWVWVWA